MYRSQEERGTEIMVDYTDEATLQKLYVDERLTVKQMAARFYCAENTVIWWMKRYGIPRRQKGKGSGRKAKRFICAGKEALTVRQIAERAGICESTVRQRLARGLDPEELLRGPQKRGRRKGWSPRQR